MFVPGITKRSSSTTLEKRKGGGGGGRGGGGGGRGGGSKSGGSSGKGSGSGGGSRPSTSSSTTFNYGGKSKSSSTYNRGGGPSTVVPAGQPFAGRLAGGGSRNQIFGTRSYGSGYGSGYASRGVGGRPFPFFFWPVVWGGGALLAADTYLDARREYGEVNNSTRPGGALAAAVFQSAQTPSTTFRLVADNDTATALVTELVLNCSFDLATDPTPGPNPLDPGSSVPRPEQVVQYYRASSVALTLDGYNNTATYATEDTLDTPLPSSVDTTLLQCLNDTIGRATPLVNGTTALWTPSYFNLVGILWTLWFLMKLS